MSADSSNVARFEELCLALAPRLKSLAARLTGSHLSAEDVFQEAVLRVWRKLPDLGPETNLGGYLARVVANLCVEKYRRESREVPSFSLTADFPSEDGDPSSSLESRELAPILRRALNSLPERQRAALVLRYFEDLEFAEIALLLGCSESAVRSHISRAKAALKYRLRFIPAFRNACPGEDSK